MRVVYGVIKAYIDSKQYELLKYVGSNTFKVEKNIIKCNQLGLDWRI